MKLTNAQAKVATNAQETIKAHFALRLEKAGKAEKADSQTKKVTKYGAHFDNLVTCYVLSQCNYDASKMNEQGYSNPYTLKKTTDFASTVAGNVSSKIDDYDRTTFLTMYSLVKEGINKIEKIDICASMLHDAYISRVKEEKRKHISKAHNAEADSTVTSQWSSTKNNFVLLGMLKPFGKEEWLIDAESYAFKAMVKALKLEE